jgi:hypothetical protein
MALFNSKYLTRVTVNGGFYGYVMSGVANNHICNDKVLHQFAIVVGTIRGSM